MKATVWMLSFALAFSACGVAAADEKEQAAASDEKEQAKAACENEKQQEGTGPVVSKVACAIKVVFQNRIRRRKETEPVEMTVGSPPMQTDDTETPGPHNWEVNLAVNGDLAGRERLIEAPLLDVNYGIGDKVQLKYEVPYIFARQDDPNATSGPSTIGVDGLGDSIVGVKYRFYDNNDSGLSFAVYPQIQFRTPGAPRAVSEGRTSVILPLVMTREFEHSSISANVGVKASSAERRYFASFGVGKRLSDHLAIMVEVAGNDLNAADERRVLFNIGLRRKISDRRTIVGSLGRDISAGGDLTRQTYFSIAYEMEFGE